MNNPGHPAPTTGFDTPLMVFLTIDEVLKLAVDFTTAHPSSSSHMGRVQCLLEFVNERTGHACRLGYGEYLVEESGPPTIEYTVELQAGRNFAVAHWSFDAGQFAEHAHMRRSAEQTLITWSALIGVPVGYGLMAEPPKY